jgi:hypothetical protein
MWEGNYRRPYMRLRRHTIGTRNQVREAPPNAIFCFYSRNTNVKKYAYGIIPHNYSWNRRPYLNAVSTSRRNTADWLGFWYVCYGRGDDAQNMLLTFEQRSRATYLSLKHANNICDCNLSARLLFQRRCRLRRCAEAQAFNFPGESLLDTD